MNRESDRIDLGTIRDRLTVLAIAESFFQSSVLFALTKLRIFELIGEGDRHLDVLAAELEAKPDTLARLLNGGVALNLLETQDGITYRVAPMGRSVMLPSAVEAYLGDWIRNLPYFNAALLNLDQAVLKSTPAVDPSTHLGTDADRTREFTLAMHNYAAVY